MSKNKLNIEFYRKGREFKFIATSLAKVNDYRVHYQFDEISSNFVTLKNCDTEEIITTPIAMFNKAQVNFFMPTATSKPISCQDIQDTLILEAKDCLEDAKVVSRRKIYTNYDVLKVDDLIRFRTFPPIHYKPNSIDTYKITGLWKDLVTWVQSNCKENKFWVNTTEFNKLDIVIIHNDGTTSESNKE